MAYFILTIYRHVEFEDAYDGILYGASISLVLQRLKIYLYLLTYGTDIAFLRALLPVSSHALFGVVMGYYIGEQNLPLNPIRRIFYLSLF